MVKDKTAPRWIIKLLAAPVFEDEDKSRTASVLNIMLLAALGLTVTSCLVFSIMFPGWLLGILIHGAVLLPGVGALLLVRRGHVQQASVWFAALMWAAITLCALFFGGVRGFTFGGHILVILIAGLLLGGRGGIAFAGLSAATSVGLAYVEDNGILPPPSAVELPIPALATSIAYFGFAAILLYLYTRGTGEALACVRRSERNLLAEVDRRKLAEEQIQASLKEKEVLLQEIHHRVKNNMQVISSLLNLQSGYVDDPQALEVFQESQHRVRSMALIHEKLYQSENLAQIDFGEYVRSLVTFLSRSYSARAGDITLDIRVDDVSLGIDTAVPCGLILNELVSNALKHAFPDGRAGEIRVELTADDERRVALTVGDNGVGFPGDLDWRSTTSLGLQLVHTLVGQLEGSVEMHSNGGTKFKIQFGLAHKQ